MLFFGKWDWANIANRVARAINSQEGHGFARVCTVHSHPFAYCEDMIIDLGNHLDLNEAAASADWLISVGDGEYDALSLLDGLLRRNVHRATLHVGSAFRAAPVQFAKQDRVLGFERRFVLPDLYRFCHNDPLVVPFIGPPEIDTGLPTPVNGLVRIGHSPSSRSIKGTERILAALQDLANAETILIEGVSYNECVRRRASVHVFVDQLNPEVGGFGMSSMEAMAQGCAVLADMRHVADDVWTHIARPPIIDVRDERSLRREVERLVANHDVLEMTRQASLAWIHEYASASAVTAFWKKHLGYSETT